MFYQSQSLRDLSCTSELARKRRLWGRLSDSHQWSLLFHERNTKEWFICVSVPISLIKCPYNLKCSASQSSCFVHFNNQPSKAGKSSEAHIMATRLSCESKKCLVWPLLASVSLGASCSPSVDTRHPSAVWNHNTNLSYKTVVNMTTSYMWNALNPWHFESAI